MYNKLLQKQLKKYDIEQKLEELNPKILEAINSSYNHFDADRILIERSMEISNNELSELNITLRQDLKHQDILLEKLKGSFLALKGDYSLDLNATDNLIKMANLIEEEIQERFTIATELEESQANVLSLIENIGEAIFSIDSTGKLLIFNSSAGKLYSEMYGKELKKGAFLISDDESSEFFIDTEEFWNATDGQQFSVSREFIINGNRHFYDISINPILSERSVVGITLFAKNTTSRKRNELLQEIIFEISEATNNSETVELFYECVQIALNKILYCENIAIVRFDEFNQVLHFPFTKGRVKKEKGERVLSTGFVDYVIDKQGAFLVTPSNNMRFLKSGMNSIMGVPLASEKKIIGAIVIYSYEDYITYDSDDLSLLQYLAGNIAISIERKESKYKLLDSEKQYRKVVDNIREVIFQADITGNWTFLNPAWVEVTGHSISESINHNFLHFIHDEDKIKFLNSFQPLIHKEQRYFEEEFRFISISKTTIWLKIYAQLNYDKAGNTIGIFGTLNDITETKQYETELISAKEKAEEGAKAKSEFLAIMSHEIRTPLNGILGMTQIIRDTELSKEQKEYLDIIDISGKSLLAIINDILDFSKIEAGQMDLEEAQFELIDCIEDSIHLCAQIATEKGLEINYFLDPNVKTTLIGDAVRMRQIFINLVNNAVKFTDSGHVHIYVKETSNTDGVSTVEFKVSDTGIGISKEKQNRLFKAFSQADTSTSRKYGGTGLGLAICSRLARLMRGSIRCESEEGSGTDFIFDVKLKGSNSSLYEEFFNYDLTNYKDVAISYKNISKSLTEFLIYISKQLDLVFIPFEKGKPCDLLITSAESDIVFGTKTLFINPHIKNITENPDLATIQSPIKHLMFVEKLLQILSGEERIVKIVDENKRMVSSFAEENPLDILIVEDNEINQITIKTILEKMGYSPKIANDGIEALERLESESFGLILMDLQMPNLDGFETTLKIFEKYDFDECPKILALSANALDEDIKRCYEIGMDDFLCKPIVLEDLQNALILYS